MKCKNCGEEMLNGTDFCFNCGVNQSEIKFKMGWYAFITYFYMPFSALCAIIVGVIHMPNIALNILNYIDKSLMCKFIFLDSTEFEILFLISGLIEFAFAVYEYYIAFRLLKYKRNVLRHLCAERILHFVFFITYMSVFIILIKGNLNTSGYELTAFFRNIASQLVSVIIWLAINIKYFKNRKHLFIN